MSERKQIKSTFPYYAMVLGGLVGAVDCPNDDFCLTHLFGATSVIMGAGIAILENYETMTGLLENIGNSFRAHKYDLSRKLTGKIELEEPSLYFSYLHR